MSQSDLLHIALAILGILFAVTAVTGLAWRINKRATWTPSLLRGRVERVLVILATIALMILIGRDLWVRHRFGERSPQYRHLTGQDRV